LKQDNFAEKAKEVEELVAQISKQNQAVIEHNECPKFYDQN
jgi:hypothetical protein